jgi:hypothetical protein
MPCRDTPPIVSLSITSLISLMLLAIIIIYAFRYHAIFCCCFAIAAISP